jgi:hypothetical protein
MVPNPELDPTAFSRGSIQRSAEKQTGDFSGNEAQRGG